MRQRILHFIKTHKLFTACAVLLLGLLAVAVFAPYIAPHDPYEAIMTNSLLPPCREYPFGADRLGRCLLSRIIFGLRTSVSTALILVAVVFTGGTFLGVIAGYFEGWIDQVIMRASDIMISFPGIVLAIAVAGLMGSSMMYTVLALAAISWTKYAKLSRSLVFNMKKSDYISAAIITGTRAKDIIVKYVVPNIIPTMVVTAVMDIGTVMLELAGLSFLGFGAQPPTPEWGLMLNEGRQHLQTSPWLIMFPGFAIIVVVVIFNLMGDQLRDILDPQRDI